MLAHEYVGENLVATRHQSPLRVLYLERPVRSQSSIRKRRQSINGGRVAALVPNYQQYWKGQIVTLADCALRRKMSTMNANMTIHIEIPPPTGSLLLGFIPDLYTSRFTERTISESFATGFLGKSKFLIEISIGTLVNTIIYNIPFLYHYLEYSGYCLSNFI